MICAEIKDALNLCNIKQFLPERPMSNLFLLGAAIKLWEDKGSLI